MQLISPKVGLSIVKKAIEKTINKKIEKFDIVCNVKKDLVLFRLYNYTDAEGKFHDSILKKYDDKNGLAKYITAKTQKELKNGEVLDVVIVSYEKMNCELFITTKEGIKTAKLIKL